MQGSQGQVGPPGEKGNALKLDWTRTYGSVKLVNQYFVEHIDSLSDKQLFGVDEYTTATLDLVQISLFNDDD